MALSGNFSGKTSNQYVKPTVYWWAVQNIEGNFSDVTVELRYSRTNTGYTTEGNFSGALYIDKGTDGQQKQTGSKGAFKVTYKSNSLAMSKTFRVYHDQNGSRKITISATGSIPPSSVTSTTVSQEVELDTIPRASTVGATDAGIGTAALVVVTKKNRDYRHSVAYSFGALSGYLRADGSVSEEEVIFSETNVAFLLPEAFYAQIPKAKSGRCTLTCRTYYGDTRIGEEKTAVFNAVAAESVCAPAVSGTVEDGNQTTGALTGDKNVLVRYHSTALCAITASARNSASLTSKTVNGKAIGSTLEIPNIETGSFCFAVKDSRGYSKTAAVEKTLIPYIKLTANASVKRTDPTGGRAVLTVKGNFYNGGFGAEGNSLTLGCQVGTEEAVTLTPVISGNTYTASAELTGLAYDQTFPVTVTARDKLETVTASLTLQKGIPTFDWGEKDFQFHVPVLDQYSTKISNGVAQYSTEQIDPNTTLESLILTNHANGPRSGYDFYIRTTFDSKKSTTAGRVQIAEPYETAGGVYWRVFSSAGWSAWEKLANATDIADHRMKTFYSISQFGLSGQPTTDEVFAAMPVMSCLVIDNRRGNTNNISDAPTAYCSVILFKGKYSYGQGFATKVNSSAKETYVFDWYNGGSYNGWARVGSNMKLLWENGSPTSTFAAQSVSIDGANYDCYLVVPHVSSNVDICFVQPTIAYKGKSGHLSSLPNNKIARRKFAVNSAGTSISFEAAEYGGTYGATSTNNEYVIPVYIYGMYLN